MGEVSKDDVVSPPAGPPGEEPAEPSAAGGSAAAAPADSPPATPTTPSTPPAEVEMADSTITKEGSGTLCHVVSVLS